MNLSETIEGITVVKYDTLQGCEGVAYATIKGPASELLIAKTPVSRTGWRHAAQSIVEHLLPEAGQALQLAAADDLRDYLEERHPWEEQKVNTDLRLDSQAVLNCLGQ